MLGHQCTNPSCKSYENRSFNYNNQRRHFTYELTMKLFANIIKITQAYERELLEAIFYYKSLNNNTTYVGIFKLQSPRTWICLKFSTSVNIKT